MADDNEIAFKLGVEPEGAKSLADLKKEFKELQGELSKTKEGTKEYQQVLQRLGAVKDDIGDLRDTISALNPEGKVAAFTNFAGKLASGFSAAQGAAALFGTQSEELEKTLLKVQAATALSNGIKEVSGLTDAFKVLNTVVKANPIAAIVAGFTALATIAAVVYEKFFSISAQQQEILENQKQSVEVAKEHFNIISKEENILKLAGKTQKEILDLKIKATDEEIAALSAQLQTQKALKQSQIDTAERNKDILEGILKFTTAPLQLILDGIDYIYEKVKGKKLFDIDLAEAGAKLLFNPEKVASEADKAIKGSEDALLQLKNQRAGFQLQIQEIDKKAYEDRKKLEEKELEERKKREKEMDDYRRQIQKDWEKDQAKTREDFKNSKFDNNQDDKVLDDDLTQTIIANYDKKVQAKKDATDKEKKLEEEKAQAVKQGLQASQALTDLYFGYQLKQAKGNVEKERELKKKQFNVNKAFGVANAVIDGVRSVQSALAVGPPIGYVLAVISGVLAAANIVKIASAKFDDGGSSGSTGDIGSIGSTASAPAIQTPNNTVTKIPDDGKIENEKEKNTPVVKAVVVETDITDSQKRINNIKETATIG